MGAGLLGRVLAFADGLRQAGVPVSTAELIDASSALKAVGWERRPRVRSALRSTMIKNAAHGEAFDTLFDIYFPAAPGDALQLRNAVAGELGEQIVDALLGADLGLLERLAAESIRRFGEMEPGRAAGGRYYQWKVERALDLPWLRAKLADRMNGGGFVSSSSSAALVEDFRRLIGRLIREHLVAERGPEAMARALSRPLPEEVDFLQASAAESAELRRMMWVLSRRLAARLAYKHHTSGRGKIDFRRTFRSSLETGGVPLAPRLRRRVRRPELVLLCDLSGSVAAFSRFTLMLVHALASHFTKVRSFAFIDTTDEVTKYFEGSDYEEASTRVRTEASIVWLDGHSDYGHSLKVFRDRWVDAVTPRSTVLLLGDCRNNFGATGAGHLEDIRGRARRVYILNPEPQRHWDTGDSVVSAYQPVCDGVHECRNLRQLSEFIEKIA